MAGAPEVKEALGLAAGSARAAEVVVGSGLEAAWRIRRGRGGRRRAELLSGRRAWLHRPVEARLSHSANGRLGGNGGAGEGRGCRRCRQRPVHGRQDDEEHGARAHGERGGAVRH